jgi:pilus assembly protein CpaE
MIYSSHSDQELLVRCMRAGAREFLSEPVRQSTVAEAFVRAAARRHESRLQKKTTGKVLIFIGAKGGCGTTTLATNFAVVLAKTSGAKVAFLDLDLELGDAALTLGVTPQFSIFDALENIHRLDSDFLSTLLTPHNSGVSVLASPDHFTAVRPSQDSIEKLLRVMRSDFPYVVVDAGSGLRDIHSTLFEIADTVYLVSQVNLSELRNSNRLITRHFNGPVGDKLEIILNRFTSRALEADEDTIRKALTRPAKWKLPNEYSAARRALNAGIPLALENTSVSRVLVEIARSACGQSVQGERKRRFGLFG